MKKLLPLLLLLLAGCSHAPEAAAPAQADKEAESQENTGNTPAPISAPNRAELDLAEEIKAEPLPSAIPTVDRIPSLPEPIQAEPIEFKAFASPQRIIGVISAVKDGDTVVIGGNVYRVWLADCPEIAHNSREIDQPYGRAALAYSTRYALGKRATVVAHGESFGRIVGDIVIDGKSLARGLIRAGLAEVDHRYSDKVAKAIAAPYLADEQYAKDKGERIWSGPHVEPWLWRKGARESSAPFKAFGAVGPGLTELTGDVTGSGFGKFATQLATNAVTYAKLQASSAGFTLLSKVDTGSGNFAELALGTNTFPARSSSGNITAKTVSDFALTILDDTTAAAVRTTILAYPQASIVHVSSSGVATPYSDLDSARNGASDGTIVVHAGSYSPTASLLKNNLTYFFLGKVALSVTSDTLELFGDGGSAINCKVFGSADIVHNVVDTQNGSTNIVHTTNASSDVLIECNSMVMHGSSDSECSTVLCAAGKLRVKAKLLNSGGGTDYTVWWTNGDLHVAADEIGTSSAYPYTAIYSQVSATPTGGMFVKVNHIYADVALANGGSDTTAAAWVEVLLTEGASGSKIYDQSGGYNRCYISNCEKAIGHITSASGSGLFYLNAQKHAASINGTTGNANLVQWASGTLRYSATQHIDPVTFTGESYGITGGTVYMEHCGDYTGGSSAKGITVTGGTLDIDGINFSTAANSSTNAISASGGAVTVRNAKLASNASGKDLAQSSTGAISAYNVIGSGTNGQLTTSGTIAQQNPINGLTVTPSTGILTIGNSQTLNVTTGGTIGSGSLAYITPGTGVATAGAINIGSAGSIVTNGGALGTPSSGNGSNLTSLTAANISVGALSNGMTGTTQTAGDNSTKLATTAYANALVDDTAYNESTWNGVTTRAPSMNAVRDKIEAMSSPVTVLWSDATEYTVVGDGTHQTIHSDNIPANTLQATGDWIDFEYKYSLDNSGGDSQDMEFKINGTDIINSSPFSLNDSAGDLVFRIRATRLDNTTLLVTGNWITSGLLPDNLNSAGSTTTYGTTVTVVSLTGSTNAVVDTYRCSVGSTLKSRQRTAIKWTKP